jgi:hypothetical protein
MLTQSNPLADAEAGIHALLDRYLAAVRANDLETLRATFDPKANIAHYYVKGDAVRTISLDQFIETIASLHAKYDNAEEKGGEVDIRIMNHLASVRLPFAFVMGPNVLEGEDLFNLAFCKGEWKIIHKSYYL